MNQSLLCPACHQQLSWRELRRDDAIMAPRRFGLAWPRCYCPHCGAQLRSNFRSLTAGVLLMGCATALFVIAVVASGPWSQQLVGGAFIAAALAAPVALRLHRFVVVVGHIRQSSAATNGNQAS